MPKVIIAYDPDDLSKVGTTVEVSNDEAVELIARGRARLADGEPDAAATAVAESSAVVPPPPASLDLDNDPDYPPAVPDDE